MGLKPRQQQRIHLTIQPEVLGPSGKFEGNIELHGDRGQRVFMSIRARAPFSWRRVFMSVRARTPFNWPVNDYLALLLVLAVFALIFYWLLVHIW